MVADVDAVEPDPGAFIDAPEKEFGGIEASRLGRSLESSAVPGEAVVVDALGLPGLRDFDVSPGAVIEVRLEPVSGVALDIVVNGDFPAGFWQGMSFFDDDVMVPVWRSRSRTVSQ